MYRSVPPPLEVRVDCHFSWLPLCQGLLISTVRRSRRASSPPGDGTIVGCLQLLLWYQMHVIH